MNCLALHLVSAPLLLAPLVAGAFSFDDPAGPQFTEVEKRAHFALGFIDCTNVIVRE